MQLKKSYEPVMAFDFFYESTWEEKMQFIFSMSFIKKKHEL